MFESYMFPARVMTSETVLPTCRHSETESAEIKSQNDNYSVTTVYFSRDFVSITY